MAPVPGGPGERRKTQAEPGEDPNNVGLKEELTRNARASYPPPAGITSAEQAVVDDGEEYDEEADYYDEEVEETNPQPQQH